MEQENVNIFDEAKPGAFFKFEKVGDAVQGTYIGKMRGRSKFNNGESTIIYVLQDKNKNVWNISFVESKTVVHERMKDIFFGQIVGFRFDEERASQLGNPAKIIKIYADPKFIDQGWIDSQKALGVDPNKNTDEDTYRPEKTTTDEGKKPGDPAMFNGKPYEYKDVPEDAQPAGGNLPKEEKPKNEAIDAIRQLARTKGLTEDGMNEKMADDTIEQFAGLSLTEENLTKIIIKLTSYTKK
jgi:hypothetical protein